MDEIECIICSHIQLMPSILPCCHKSVCNSHISESCPICKIPINPEEVINNWLLQSLMQSPESFPCERCDESPSSYYCQNCRVVLCETCYEEVHKGKFASHKYTNTTNYDYEENNCKTHDMPIEYFCTEEWKGICLGCFDMHEDHPILNINEAAAQTLHEVRNKRIRLQKIQEQVKYEIDELEITNNEIERKFNDMVEITKDSFNQLRKLIDLKEAETLNCIESVKDKKNSETVTMKSILSKKWKRLDNVMRMIDIAKDLPASVMMESMKYLTSLIQTSISTYESSLSSFNTTFPYPDFKSLFQSIDVFSYNELGENTPKDVTGRNSVYTPAPVHRRSNLGSSQSSRYTSPVPFRYSTPSAIFAQSTEDSLEQRKFTSKFQTCSAIKLSWSHCTAPVTYILEYGIGSKTSGIEQFRQVYQGSSYNCLITDLLPKTTYGFRVSAINESNVQGAWSEIASVATLDQQIIDDNSLKNTGTLVKRGEEKWIQFERAGMIQGIYPYAFGKHFWEVKILCSPFYANEDSSGWLKIGVSSYKNKQVIGIVHNYSTIKSIRIFVSLDVDAQILKCKTSESQDSEEFVIGEGAQLPTIQYRPSKNSRNNVKIMVKFGEKQAF